MSEVELHERYIELHERYPKSWAEDITDAYMRGFQACVTILCDPLCDENERLSKKLEMEREDNDSIRRLFDAVAPRCGKPDCPSLVEYVQKLRELVHKLWSVVSWYAPDLSELDEARDTVRELGIEVDG